MSIRSTLAKMMIVGAVFVGVNCPALGAQINLEGMNAFLKLADLPLLRTGVQTHQFCSYDRAGGLAFLPTALRLLPGSVLI
jgi:hypothetical protein